MKSRLWIAVFTAVLLFSTACSTGDVQSQVETGIAQTQEAQGEQSHPITVTPAPTDKPIETDTPTLTNLPPSPTIEPTSTDTPTPLPTATPDLRIIIGKPEEFILQKVDFPNNYILRPGGSTPHENKEILAARGNEEGKAYLEATGRIGGWIIFYQLVDTTAIAPDWIRSYVVMYNKLDGCNIYKNSGFDVIYEDFEVVDMKLDLGDWNRVTSYRERQPNGKYILEYVIEFCYKNVWAEVIGQGMESDVTHEYLENLARKVLAKLEAAPLALP